MVDRMRLIASRVQENVLICAFEGSRVGFLELPLFAGLDRPVRAAEEGILGTGFGSEKEHVCGRPHAMRRCGRTLRPDNRCDPGLASVRGRDWPALETRRVEHVHQIQRHATRAALRRSAARRSLPGPSWRSKAKPGPEGRSQASRSRLVKEIRAKAGAPIWRRDKEKGHTYALKLTAAGVKAIAVDATPPSQGEAERRADHLMVSVDPRPEPGSDPAAFVDRASGRIASTLKFPRGELRSRGSSNCCRVAMARPLPSLSRTRAGCRIPRGPRLQGYASAATPS